jgi:uncharacterized protein (TIGR03382 family)
VGTTGLTGGSTFLMLGLTGLLARLARRRRR